MVIILPDKVDGLSKLQENLNTVVDACNTRLQQTYEREVKLYLPKFKTETKLDLTDTLSNEVRYEGFAKNHLASKYISLSTFFALDGSFWPIQRWSQLQRHIGSAFKDL